MERLRAENRNLKLNSGGVLDPDDDQALYEDFVTKLGKLLESRHSGKGHNQELFDEYQVSTN